MPGLNELLDDGAGPVAGIVVHNHNFIGQFTVVLMKRAPASNSARSSHRLYVHTSMEISMWSPTLLLSCTMQVDDSRTVRYVRVAPAPPLQYVPPPRQGEA